MCDKDHFEEDLKKYLRAGSVTRRDFGTLTTAVGLAMLLPRTAGAQAVTESDVEIKTPDGTADCYFVRPSSGAHAAVLVWPDILGLRPAFRMMGKRLAESGYSVLVVNPFYRQKRAPVVPEGASFADESVRNTVFPLAQALNATTHMTDAKAFVAWLDAQPSVDKNRKIGTTGYCMGGSFVFRTAASLPYRIGAGCSFHGGGLTTTNDDSPHLLIPKMKASMLIAIADNDDQKDPTSKDILRKAFDDAKVSAEIEVYKGANHGWMPPDSQNHNAEAAERGWERKLALFRQALA